MYDTVIIKVCENQFSVIYKATFSDSTVGGDNAKQSI
jgi:hypothetical protein